MTDYLDMFDNEGADEEGSTKPRALREREDVYDLLARIVREQEHAEAKQRDMETRINMVERSLKGGATKKASATTLGSPPNQLIRPARKLSPVFAIIAFAVLGLAQEYSEARLVHPGILIVCLIGATGFAVVSLWGSSSGGGHNR